jgi:uncharacterized protein involved in outer membrane biogenesis
LKALFKLLLVLSGLLVVILITVTVTFVSLDPNEHKDWISEQALERTGRTLSLEGDIDVTFYPWLGIEVNKLTVGNAAGFGDTPFLQAEYLKLRIKLMPILKDRYVVDTVSVRGAVINLAKNKEGVSNWDDLIGEEKSDDSAALPLAAVVLGGVDVQQASLNWNDASNDTQYKISNMNIKTDALRYGEPLKLNLDMDVVANKPALSGHVGLNGTIAYNLDKQLYSIRPLGLVANIKGANIPGGETKATMSADIDLDLDKDTAMISDIALDALDTKVRGSVTASRIQTPGPSVQTAIKVDGADLAQLFKVAEIEPLATQLAGISNRGFTLDANIDADLERGDVDVSTLALAMLGATVDGNIKANNIFSETPAYRGKLKAGGPDLPTLLQVLGQFQGGSESALTQYGLTIAKGKHKSFKVDAVFDADLKTGEVDISTLAVALLGATVEGNVKASNVLSETPGYKGKLNAAGPDLPTLLQVIGQAQGDPKSSLLEYGKKFASLKNKAFKIDTGFDADFKNGDINVPTLAIDTLGIKVAGKLVATAMHTDNGVVNGNLNISGNKISGLLTALDQKALSEVVKSINLNAGISGNASNFSLKPMALKATLAGKQVGKTPVDVSLNADTNINLGKQTLSMAGLSLKGLGLNVGGSVRATKFIEAPAFSGDINVAAFNLRSLMSKLNQELPVTADKKVFSNVALSTKFAGSGNNLKLEELTMVLDQTNLRGNFSVSDFAKPEIRFGLNIDKINADRYLSPVEDGKNKPITPETAASAAVQLPVETLQAINMKGNLSIGKLTISKARLSNVKLSLDGKDGKIKLAPIAANLYQGSYSGKITINANGKLPKVVVNSSIKGVQIEPLLKDTMGNADLVGKSDISIAVVARGKNTDTFKQTLSGQAELKVVNGIVRGVDVPRALEQVEIMLESKRFGKVNTEGNTPFNSLTATLPINAGVVSNEDLILSAPGFKVRGRGVLARLVDMTWKYDLKIGVDERSVAKNDKTYNIGDYTIPVKCRGKIAGANCKADKMNLAGAAVKKMLLDKLIPRNNQPADAGTTTTNATDPNIDPGKELLDKALKSIFK